MTDLETAASRLSWAVLLFLCGELPVGITIMIIAGIYGMNGVWLSGSMIVILLLNLFYMGFWFRRWTVLDLAHNAKHL